jgi:uncharacterized protein YlxP (DUF503 family)
MHVGALRLELRLRAVQSLKEKRHIIKSLASQLAKTFGVAVAEVDHQDLWQRATLGVAAVAPQPSQLDRILHAVQRAVRERHDVELLDSDITYLETER